MTPRVIYTYQEPALKRREITRYMQEKSIHLIMTATHAAVVERQIRTFKRMIVERLRKREEEQRLYHDQAFLDKLTNIYNHEVHRTTGMTPMDARKHQNWRAVRTQLELHRLPMHHYPRLGVGDYVRKLLKKQPFDKESDPELEQDGVQDSEDRRGAYIEYDGTGVLQARERRER
jgi:hypothetical protein